MHNIKEKGSLSLEAAIVLPIFIIMLTYIYIFITSIRLDLLYQESAYSAVQEGKLLLSIQDIDSLKDNQLDLNFDLRKKLLELFSDKINSKWISYRHEKWLTKNINVENLNFFFQDRKSYLDLNDSNSIKYIFSYKSPTILRSKTYSYSFPVPNWGGADINFIKSLLKENFNDNHKDTIWEENQFTRGRIFRKKYGANLPYNYPVISKFKNKTVTSIKSIDLTAPTYEDLNILKNRINFLSNKLQDFNGTKQWGKDNITIDINDIKRRELCIIIPSNSPSSAILELENLKSNWSHQNINITINKYAESKKYID